MAAEGALRQILGHDLVPGGRVEGDFAAAESVGRVIHQRVQRRDHVVAGEIGGDVVGIGDADVGRGVGGDVGDDVVVDLAVVGVQAHGHGDAEIQRLKGFDGLLIDGRLGLVGVIFGPEGDFVAPGRVERLGNLEGAAAPGAVAARERQQRGNQHERQQSSLHPLVPPLATPAMTLRRKIRNSVNARSFPLKDSRAKANAASVATISMTAVVSTV